MSAVTIRFPESLHRRLKAMAKQEGISMNQLVVLAATEKLSVLEQQAYFAERLQRAEALAEASGKRPVDLLRTLLDRAPAGVPPPEDRLPEGV